MSSDPGSICGYCGSAEATTRDHIPPKAIFPVPRPSDLVTVPSCASCNHGASDSDELFRAYLSLHVGLDTPSTGQLWAEALRGVRHNRRLHRRLLSEMEPVWLTTSSGVIHGQGARGRWDSDAHDRAIERMIRGFYFHHYQEVLGRRVTITTQWLQKLDPALVEATEECEQRSIGGGQFVYRFGRAVDHPLLSIWLFEFHKRHWAGGQTAPQEPGDATPTSG
jgi:hypothetical protein